MPENRHVFGPVPSRRLGRSLGVDLVPFKTCTYNCVYCQLGRTTNLTTERAEYVPANEVIREIRDVLDQSVPPDYVTLSGSGEPTLHTGLGEIIRAVKETCDVPVAILTNGSLLGDPEVGEACQAADLVIPSLDAADPKMFQAVNRPHREIGFFNMVDGIVRFRDHFAGQLWLEVFLLYGVTGVPPYVRLLLPFIERLNPDRVQINTAVRPTAETLARPVPGEDLEEIAQMIGPNAEVIASAGAPQKQGEHLVQREDVLAMIRRRPCSIEDVATGLGIHRNEAVKYVELLTADGSIRPEPRGDTVYYVKTSEP